MPDAILGIDPGVKSGWAVVTYERQPRLLGYGTHVLPDAAEDVTPVRMETGRIERARVLASVEGGRVIGAFIEDQYVGVNFRSSLKTPRRAGRWELACQLAGIHPQWIMPATWQEATLHRFMQRGRAKRTERKRAAQQYCEAIFGVHLTQDEADAAVLAAYGAMVIRMTEACRRASHG